MKTVEAKPVQLGLGERVIGENNFVKGVIKQHESVIVPKRKGGYCRAKLTQDTQVEEVDNCKVWGLSAYKIATETSVTKNINGNWKKWSLPEGSVIGAYSKQVKKRRREEKIITKKDFVFS